MTNIDVDNYFKNIKDIEANVKKLNLALKPPRGKYNLSLLGEEDPKIYISDSIKIMKKQHDMNDNNPVFEQNMFRVLIQEGNNGVGKDIIEGTLQKTLPREVDNLGYYSFLYYLYRYIVLYCGRILNRPGTEISKSVSRITRDILNIKQNEIVIIHKQKIIIVLELFRFIVSNLDQTNNSPVILVSNKPLKFISKNNFRLKVKHLDTECYTYLADYTKTGNDKPLIKNNFGIAESEMENFRVLSTTSLYEIITKTLNTIQKTNHLKKRRTSISRNPTRPTRHTGTSRMTIRPNGTSRKTKRRRTNTSRTVAGNNSAMNY